jgi:hypothetical protein
MASRSCIIPYLWVGCRQPLGTAARQRFATTCARKFEAPRISTSRRATSPAVGGWADITTLQRVYQASDTKTMEAVVSGGTRVPGIVR